MRVCAALMVCVPACARPSAARNEPLPPAPLEMGAPSPAPAASSADPPPPQDAAAEATTHEATTALSLGDRFQLDYPTRVFRVAKLPRGGTGALLTSTVFERYMEHTYPFEIELRIVARSVVDEVRNANYGTPIFSTHDESSFQEQPGFAERIDTASGLHGYSVSMGVEGVGQIDSFLAVSPKQTIHVTCRYCCGLIASATVTRDEQERVCDDVVSSLRSKAVR